MVTIVVLKCWALSGAMTEIVELFYSHMFFASIGLRACTEFKMSVSVRVQMSETHSFSPLMKNIAEWNFH